VRGTYLLRDIDGGGIGYPPPHIYDDRGCGISRIYRRRRRPE